MYTLLGLNTSGRYIAKTIARYAWLILFALTALFFIFDLLAESNEVGVLAYSLRKAALFALLQIPAHAYDAMPIAMVAGAIVGLASLANSSEITVLRAASLAPKTLFKILFVTGIPFVVFTLGMGEWVQPLASQKAEVLRATALGYRIGGDLKTGIWLRDVQSSGDVAYLNLPIVSADGTAPSLTVYRFDAQMRLNSRLQAKNGQFVLNEAPNLPYWQFDEAQLETFDINSAQRTKLETLIGWQWVSTVSPNALLGMQKSPERVGIASLLETVLFQQKNEVDSRKSLSILLRRMLHPLALWVMLAMAMPFAYLRARGGAVAARVFAGVLMGMGFHSGNRLFEFMSLVQGWPVWLTAQLPLWIGLSIALFLFWRFHRLH
jgi:lipopolysaccharide export system permease protein